MSVTTGFAAESSRDAALGSPFEHNWCDVALASADYYLSDVAPFAETTVFDAADLAANGPLLPSRNVVIDVTSFPATLSSASFIVLGYDSWDNLQREVLTANAVETLTGQQPFKSLVSVTVTVRGTAGDAGFDIGTGDTFGTGTRIGHIDDIWGGFIDCVAEVFERDAPIYNVRYSSWTPTTPPDDSLDYKIQGQSTFGIITFDTSARAKGRPLGSP